MAGNIWGQVKLKAISHFQALDSSLLPLTPSCKQWWLLKYSCNFLYGSHTCPEPFNAFNKSRSFENIFNKYI